MIRVADSRAARITQAVLSTTVIVKAHLVQSVVACEEAFCGGIPGAAAQLSGTNIIKDEGNSLVSRSTSYPKPLKGPGSRRREETVEAEQAGVALATEVGSVVLAQ